MPGWRNWQTCLRLSAQVDKQARGYMYVYILKSVIKTWNYVGITKNIEDRIERHNSGRTKSSKPYRPFELLFAQEVGDYKEARLLEKFLKIKFNKEALLDLI